MVTRSKTGTKSTGTKSTGSKAKSAAKSTATHERGGTSAQHAKAGHLGGIAPHTCRGRQCSESEMSKSKGKK